MSNHTDTTALAEYALATEGIPAYFGDIDIDYRTAIKLLATYLDEHPDEWTSGGSDAGWEFFGPDSIDPIAGLVAAALEATR